MNASKKPDIWFYHLTRNRLEDVLPRLLSKALDGEKSSVILCANENTMDTLNEYLWTFNEHEFLPHGSAKEPHAEEQLIYLTTAEERPNEAQLLFIVEGSEPAHMEQFERVIYLFDQRDTPALERARAYWKSLKEAGFPLSYWQQKEGGGWDKTASANN
ncbi:DNA polymerase III subunit chi [bacterium]|nr:DNA polymerase III subunit chi [bacterium]